MFEGQIEPIEAELAKDSPVLRHLRWTDLVARLAATRDYRQETNGNGEGGFASFSTALPEAGGDARDQIGEKGKRVGNHDALSHGKFAAAKPGAAANDAARSDRDET